MKNYQRDSAALPIKVRGAVFTRRCALCGGWYPMPTGTQVSFRQASRTEIRTCDDGLACQRGSPEPGTQLPHPTNTQTLPFGGKARLREPAAPALPLLA